MTHSACDAQDRGFAIHEAVFTPAEVAALIERISARDLLRSRAGSRHVLSVPEIATIANDARALAIAARWLGSPATAFKATLFDKSPDANWLVAWHQDTALPLEERVDTEGWGPWSEKQGIIYAHAPARALEQVIALRIHLDDSSPANGPLRVLPGTHRMGVLSDEQVAAQARLSEPVECTAPAGSIVAMRPLIIHASSKVSGDAPRRVLHVEYTASLHIGQGLRLRLA